MTAPLKVIHCLRAPVGGLFRHVCDLVRGQAARGLKVGIICEAHAGKPLYEAALRDVKALCDLGVHRLAMHRRIAATDITTALAVRRLCRDLDADIIHGHGAKGGAYARFAAIGRPQKTFYTPHGGSLHYERSSVSGFVFLGMEKLLGRLTDGLIFESHYGLETYRRKVGVPACAARVIHNGVDEREFEPVTPSADAADFLFIGELRTLKGVDILLSALAAVRQERDADLVIVGSGPDADMFRDIAASPTLCSSVTFRDPMPARDAFALGRVLIVPSLAESLPYIVLEALAAGKPTLATRVGGIPEIFDRRANLLVPPGDVGSLAAAMRATFAAAQAQSEICADLQSTVRARFTVARMVDAVSNFYAECLGASGAAIGPISGHRSPAK